VDQQAQGGDWRRERRLARRRKLVRRRRLVALFCAAALAGAGASLWTSLGDGSAGLATGLSTASASHSKAGRSQAGTRPAITFEWAGDTVLGSSYGLPPNGGRGSLAAVSRALHRADLTWGNLEETLSAGGTSKCAGSSSSTCFAFQAPPSYARLLHAAGFDLMNIANNHQYDFGASGVRQTTAALRRAHVAWTGRPRQITVLQAKGVKIAFLGFAPYPWASPLTDIAAAQRLVRKAAARADLVVVAIHAGAEGSGATHVPRGTEYFLGENRGNSRAFAHAVIRAGADLVVGSGPHVIRGVEWYHGRLITYSTGNFAGYHNFGTGGTLSLSAIFRTTLRPDGGFVSGRWVSVYLVDPGLPHLDPSKASLRLVARLSRSDFGAHGARFSADGWIRRP
jgi:poly-gamma-glutamate capsule biosynthesis protein CapA/YwtB (metallophosphatase superfamily)